MNETHEKEVLLSVKNIGVTFGRGAVRLPRRSGRQLRHLSGRNVRRRRRKRFRQDDDRTLHHAHTADYAG